MQAQQYLANQVAPLPQNALAGAYIGKPEQETANVQVLPHVDADIRPYVQVPGMTREAELDARQQALEARERELAEREARSDTVRV